ncbi:histone-lysine N-methyltransferase SETDB1-B-like [Chaetodon trifascialis]|uniref:histone-lysine N-methyltransferase SETDB1-B-like n=1 Tax=Chaetodon trifascialis TaxID=109706 RepID=UPI0039936AE4
METTTSEVQESGERRENKRKAESDEPREDDVNLSDSPCESVPSTNETPSKKTPSEDGSEFLRVTKKAVVVLTRLPEYATDAVRPPTSQQFYSEDESLRSSDSDMQWEPDTDSSDSDFSVSKTKQKNVKPMKSDTTTIPSQPSPQIKKNINVSKPALIISSAFACSPDETTKVRPNLPEEEVKVDMMVLARKRPLRWQRGKIVEIVTREDGKLKYKVNFEEKGKSLVSGHHIAFDTIPTSKQLYVGARVVVGCEEDKLLFKPGILAELPTRKNRLRFLVFLDDHIPVYVGLPLLHLVCRPLEDVVDDIPDSRHKSFMSRYLKDWPYPHLTQYKAGQSLNVELNGVQQRCEVQVVDSSLMQVVFQENQHTEWIHRGSIRLEHMTRFLELRRVAEQKDG